MTGPDAFVKQRAEAPPQFFAWEAAGLAWLGRADGGTAVVEVHEVGDTRIVLERIAPAPATRAAAQAFGRSLARTHAAGADAFGAAAPGWNGDGWIGRQELTIRPFDRWGEFYATTRLQPYARAAHRVGHLSAAAVHIVDRVCARLVAGEFDDDTPPARIHGDLWGGNVLYGRLGTGSPAAGAVLIDPAAHGGHGLTDLAMLALFGTEHLSLVLAAYAEAAQLRPDWADLIGLHQLHPLLVHAVSHGPSYGQQAVAVADRYR
ncbi:MAG TPA: fructosamine kinase family protein [Nakamurella multipartita]|nr:fructosamine kinase family protein [Nakamurella multipartita]